MNFYKTMLWNCSGKLLLLNLRLLHVQINWKQSNTTSRDENYNFRNKIITIYYFILCNINPITWLLSSPEPSQLTINVSWLLSNCLHLTDYLNSGPKALFLLLTFVPLYIYLCFTYNFSGRHGR